MALFFSLVGLLPLFIGIVFLFKSTEGVIQEDACNNLGRLVKNVREELCRFLCGCVVDMNMLAESEAMKDTGIPVDKKLSEMKKIQDYYRRFEDITLINMNGRVITSTTYNYRGEWKSKKWFQEAAKGKAYISDAHIILDPYKVVIAIAVPLTDDRRTIQAVMVGHLNMEQMWGIVDSIKVGKTGYVAIVNDQNFFIAHPHKGNLFRPAPFETDKPFGMVYPEKSESEPLLYSTGKFLCKADYQFPKWRIIVAQEGKEVVSSVLRLKYSVICILAAGLFLVITVSILVSRGIVRPIRTLVRGIAKVSHGDLSYKTTIKSKDEIGLLGASFNEMTARLEKAHREIETKTETLQDAVHKINDLNVSLEKKVAERTKELKEKQYQLVQSSKLAAIGQLGAGVAHELNNPLTGILGYTQFILKLVSKENFNPEDAHTLRKYLQYIETGTRQCREIVQNLLRFARKSTENFESLNINNVIADTLSLIEHQLLVNKIELVKNLDGNVHQITGNTIQLQQVFTNMIINAQQAMPDGGRVIISTGNNHNMVEIAFKDTGCGIAEEHKDRIFEPFFTTKMDWKGTGLGLSICYDIIRNHNGNISVDSLLGKGTTFTVSLPVKGETR